MRSPARQASRLPGKASCTNVSDHRLPARLTQKAKIASDSPLYQGNFRICGLCRSSAEKRPFLPGVFQTAPYKCGDTPADGLRAGGNRKTECWRQNGIFQASADTGTRVFPWDLFALSKIPVAKFLRPARRLLAGIPEPFPWQTTRRPLPTPTARFRKRCTAKSSTSRKWGLLYATAGRARP